MTRVATTKIVVYILSVFVLISFISNTALIHLLEDDKVPHASVQRNEQSRQQQQQQKRQTRGLQHLRPVTGAQESGNNLRAKSKRMAPVSTPPYGSCAILLFGLPRAFQQYVLPSLVEHVIRPNLHYGCDYFVHYYHIDKEVSNGRSGRGGLIRPDDIQLLRTAVADLYQNHTNNRNNNNNDEDPKHLPFLPQVSIVHDTNETFWEKRFPQLMKYRNTRNADGKLTYFPYTEPTYVYPDTIDNIVKQWHSIDAVWNLMEETQQKHQKQRPRYQQVAMMRSDVVYVTPVDVYAVPKDDLRGGSGAENNIPQSASAVGEKETSNAMVIIPDFAKYPINDRMIIGPFDAVKLWATERFHRIDHYATNVAAPGTAMHSETFLNDTILTSIRSELHLPIYEDPWLCFLRARADGAIWIEDCDPAKSGNGGGFPDNTIMPYLRPFLNATATCRQRWLKDPARRVKELICKEGRMSNEALAEARERMLQKRKQSTSNQKAT